jgi:FkbM family methyltransferase
MFEKFLKSLEESNLEQAYACLLNAPPDAPRSAIDQLIKIFTSHFLRNRQSKNNTLLTLKNSGFDPAIVFDIGAQIGTPELFTVFPSAHHVMVEPVHECIPALELIQKQLASATIYNCAVSNVNESTFLSVTASRQYSSIEEKMGEESREIEVRTVDSIYEDIKMSGSILLKIDVDGIEIKVLQGSKSLLKRNDCVIVIEASIGDHGPRFNNIVEYMNSYGYDVFDIVDPLYRQSDWHLWQVDLVFVKKDSPYWGSKSYI